MLNKFLVKIFSWRSRYIGSHTFMIFASILVGIISALAAVILKNFVHLMERIPEYFFEMSNTRIWFLILPVCGILLTVIVVRIFFKGRLAKGVGSILFSISKDSSKMEKSTMYSHIVTSGITIGLGGSAGLEAPIVVTGSAIGSNVGSILKLGYRERTLLLACGAASGIAAIFNSPIAGLIFAIEVILTDVSIAMFIPLLMSTATAIIISKFLYSGQLFFLITTEWEYHAIPFYLLLGVICGFVSVYITRMTLSIENYFESEKNKTAKMIAGSLLLGSLIFLFPPLFGEGYGTIDSLLHGKYSDLLEYSLFGGLTESPWLILAFVAAMILIKIIATALTIGSGGNGGIFAPSLFTGSLMGFSLAYLVNMTGISKLHTANFIAVGMAGVMSGVVHAPLTAIFLIAEITGGYILFVPLMIVAAISFFISRYFEPYTIYTKNLAQRGLLMTEDKDNNILLQLHVEELIEKDFEPVLITDRFSSILDAFTRSKRNIFPVLDENGHLAGVIELEKIKQVMFKPEIHESMTVDDVTDTRIVMIDRNETVASAMKKFESSGKWNLPVTEDGKYIGFISQSNFLSFYRRILKRSVSLF